MTNENLNQLIVNKNRIEVKVLFFMNVSVPLTPALKKEYSALVTLAKKNEKTRTSSEDQRSGTHKLKMKELELGIKILKIYNKKEKSQKYKEIIERATEKYDLYKDAFGTEAPGPMGSQLSYRIW